MYDVLKSVVARKLQVPEVYDAMEHIAELLFQGESQSIRSKCASLLLSFLLHYPLSVKKRQAHIDFVVKNL